MSLSIYSISFSSSNNYPKSTLAQSFIQVVKHGDLVIDLGNGIKTNAHLSLPAVGKGRNIVVRQKGIIYILPNGDIAMLMRNFVITLFQTYC